MKRRNEKHRSFPSYFVFAEDEMLFLIVCVVLDVSEYVVTILLLSVVGDFLDIVGVIACLVMFRWVGVLSVLELVPGVDIIPVFIITWLIWYLLKKVKKRNQSKVIGNRDV